MGHCVAYRCTGCGWNVGVSGLTLDDLLASADREMYAAKAISTREKGRPICLERRRAPLDSEGYRYHASLKRNKLVHPHLQYPRLDAFTGGPIHNEARVVVLPATPGSSLVASQPAGTDSVDGMA